MQPTTINIFEVIAAIDSIFLYSKRDEQKLNDRQTVHAIAGRKEVWWNSGMNETLSVKLKKNVYKTRLYIEYK